jgi:hypothetical protein
MVRKTASLPQKAGRPKSAKQEAIDYVQQAESTTPQTSELTTPEDEQQQLQLLEQIIESNLRAFYEVGMALKQIRDSHLYKLQGYNRFEDYCQERWDIGSRYAYMQIESSAVVDNLRTIGSHFLPTNERQARPLTKLPVEKQGEVWQKVLESAPEKSSTGEPKITTQLVEETIATVIGTTEKPPKEEKAGVKNTFYLSEETDDALNEAFYRIRQLAGKERKKVPKEAMVEVLLQIALEEVEKKKEIVVEKVLNQIARK